MLVARTTDSGRVINRVLVTLAFVCCGFVLASFGLFARDQLAGASAHQQSQIAAGVQTSPGTVAVARQPAQPRRFIDGAASALTAPFRTLVHSSGVWLTHGLPALCALLFYGVGLGYLARFSRGLR